MEVCFKGSLKNLYNIFAAAGSLPKEARRCSRSLIIQLMKLNLIDEYQLCIHPVIAGTGLPLFENIKDRTVLKLIKTKTFSGGAVTLYYEPTNEKTTNR